MAQTLPVDKRRVYLAGRAIFNGSTAQIRRLKVVRKVIDENNALFRPLTVDLGMEKVIVIVRDLLERGVFESELKAKKEFPELFYSSPKQEVRREASEIDAARSVTEAIKEIASVKTEEVVDTDEEPQEATVVVNGNHKELDTVGVSTIPDKSTPDKSTTTLPPSLYSTNLPSLYPIYIPHKAQHLILNEAQRLLEESCFEFIQKWLPSLIEEKGWECASSVELNHGTWLIASHSTTIPEEAFVNPEKKPLTEILSATNNLRHSAVHRLPNTARGIISLCRRGVALAATLGDTVRAAKLEDICNELDGKIETMKLNKNALEDAATAGLEEIKRQREELDRREKEVIARMIQEDRQNKAFMGVLLEDSVNRILTERRLPDDDETAEEREEQEEDEADKQVEVQRNAELVEEKKSRDETKEPLLVTSWYSAWRKVEGLIRLS